MARPMKQGLDYFPLDVNHDDKMKMIEAKYEVAGFGIVIKMWQIIYDNGYFIKWTERELLLYKNRINADINLINDVINECLKWDIFNKEMFDKYKILTSSGIQKRYVEAIKRRKEITIEESYWLIDVPDISGVAVFYSSLEVNADINSINDDISTQSKVKESKVKKTISKKHQDVECLLLGSVGNVKLTQEQYDKLKKEYPNDVEDIIEFLSLHIAEKGDKSTAQTHIYTIRKWVVDAVKDRKLKGWQGYNKQRGYKQPELPMPIGDKNGSKTMKPQSVTYQSRE